MGPINPSTLLVTVPRMDVLQKWFSLWLAMCVITKTCPCNLLQFITTVKKDDLHIKNGEVFLIFAQNIDCGYTLEPPQ